MKRFPSLPLVEKIATALEIQAYQLYKPQESEHARPSLYELQAALISTVTTDIAHVIATYSA